MSAKKNLSIIDSYTYTYTAKSGEEVEKTVSTRGPNGAMKIHPKGSVFLGYVTLVLDVCGIIFALEGATARIRTDGLFVVEPKTRSEEWFDSDGNSHLGSFAWDALGDENRVALAVQCAKRFPALAKREKSARAALAKRAA